MNSAVFSFIYPLMLKSKNTARKVRIKRPSYNMGVKLQVIPISGFVASQIEAWELKLKEEFVSRVPTFSLPHLTIAGSKLRMSSFIELSVKRGAILRSAVELGLFYITISSSISGEA